MLYISSMTDTILKRLKQNRPFTDEAHEATVGLFTAASYLRGLVEDRCTPEGLNFNQYNILRILKGSEHGLTRAAIIERMIDRGADVTRLINRMEKAGWVKRSRGIEDRRQTFHAITEKGTELLTRVTPGIEEIQALLTDRLAPRDLRNLIGICERLIDE